MCAECAYEYSRILDGIPKKEENPYLEAFNRGWNQIELENNWVHKEIPSEIKAFYDLLYIKKEISFQDYLEKLQEFRTKGSDGISENP